MLKSGQIHNVLQTLLWLVLPLLLAAQEIPKDVTPYVALGYELVVEYYAQPVIADGKLVDKGPVTQRKFLKTTLGSGTIVSKEGLVLTNFHVYNIFEREYDAEQNVYVEIKPASKDMLVYQLTDNDPLKEPVLKYIATPLAFDQNLDICLLQIVADAETGQALEHPNFTYVQLGNPFDIPLNSTLTILGYPGKGGQTITITDGKFLGYTKGVSNAIDGSIKTDATMAGGNSGGTALYKKKQIGLPTRGSSKQEKGFDFGYIHPVVWAAGPFSYAKMKYGTKIPPMDEKWFQSDYNVDITKTNTYVGGKLYSAQTYGTIEEGVVLLYRTDRTLDDIVNLIKEEDDIRTIFRIQSLYQKGVSAEQIAQAYETGVEQIQKILQIKISEASLSPDLIKKLNGEFFYSVASSDSKGFFFVNVPKNRTFNLYVQKEGYRNLKKQVTIGGDLFQNLGKLNLIQY